MADTRVPGEFSIKVRFSEKLTTLEVLGSVDRSTALTLRAFMNSAISSGSPFVTMELDDLDLHDPLGVRVIIDVASRLLAGGGRLTIRAPAPLSHRLADLVDFGGLVQLQTNESRPDHLALKQNEIDSRSIESRYPSRDLKRLISIPTDGDVVDGVLRLLLNIARVTVGGADGASVSLRRQGHLSTISASDQTISDMDADQYLTGEGPCVDASVKGHLFHADSLDTESRWPLFTPRARGLGIHSILSLPLLAEGQPVGALNMYSRTAFAFAPEDQEIASVLAAETSSILTTTGVDTNDDQLAQRIGKSLEVRRVIAQAEGIIMQRKGLSADDAYTELRNLSQATNQPLREAAQDVVTSTRVQGHEHDDSELGGQLG
jgi:anti-anti-sigma regulatory factor